MRYMQTNQIGGACNIASTKASNTTLARCNEFISHLTMQRHGRNVLCFLACTIKYVRNGQLHHMWVKRRSELIVHCHLVKTEVCVWAFGRWYGRWCTRVHRIAGLR